MRHVGDLLAGRAREHGERVAIAEPGGATVTFAALDDRVRRLAGGLHRVGLRPGHRMVLLLPMGIDLYVTLLGLLQGGHTAVLVDPSSGLRRVGQALERIGVHGLLGTGKAHWLRLAVPALRGGRLYASTTWTPLPARRIRSLSGEPLDPVHPPDGEPALVTFTSGTTGVPKAIGRSHAFLLAQHRVLAGHMGLSPDDVDLPTLPVFLLNSLAAGATCVLPDGDLRDVASLDPARLVAQVRAHGVTTTSGSPAYLRLLADHLRATGQTLPLAKVFAGGARVPAELLADLRAVLPDARVEVVYGSTEAEPMATLDAEAVLGETAARERAGEGVCVGLPVPGLRVRLVDPDTRAQVPRGETGEVLVTGDHVNQAYYRDPESTAALKVSHGGAVWHRTGDVAWEDEVGRLWLVGRVGQQVAGRWPFQVEAAVEQVPGVDRAALVAVDGEAVVAWTGTAEPAAVAVAAGARAVRVAELPLDPRHRAKVDRVALTRQLQGLDNT